MTVVAAVITPDLPGRARPRHQREREREREGERERGREGGRERGRETERQRETAVLSPLGLDVPLPSEEGNTLKRVKDFYLTIAAESEIDCFVCAIHSTAVRGALRRFSDPHRISGLLSLRVEN